MANVEDKDIVVSDNEQGNPNHYPKGTPGKKGGQFAPADETSIPSEEEDLFADEDFSLNEDDEYIKKENQLQQLRNLPRLPTAEKIVENLDVIFSNYVIDKLSKNLKDNGDFEYKIFKKVGDSNYSNPYIFTILSNARFKRNEVWVLSHEQFDKLKAKARNGTEFSGKRKVGNILTHRGVRSYSPDTLQSICESYTDPNDPARYSGGQNGECNGTCIYTAVDESRTATSYAKGERYGVVLQFLVDSNKANIVNIEVLYKTSRILREKYESTISNHIYNKCMEETGGNDKLSKQIVESVVKYSLRNPGLIAILMGVDGYWSYSQLDMVNCNVMKMREVTPEDIANSKNW